MRRHLSKNWPGLPHKSLENSCNEGERTQGPHLVLLVRRERGPKYTAAHKLNGVVASVAFYEVVAATTVHGQDRGPTAVFPSRSCDSGSETRRLQPLLAFVLCVALRHPIFATGSMPFWLADTSKETTVLSVLFSFQYFLCPCDAFHRFTALSGHWPFAGDSEASGCQPMPLRVGTPEWAYSLFLKKRSRPSCSSSSSAVRVRRVP